MKNATYEPYRKSKYYMPDYDYSLLARMLIESGAEEYMNDTYTLPEDDKDKG